LDKRAIKALLFAGAAGYTAGVINPMSRFFEGNGMVLAAIHAFAATFAESFDKPHLGSLRNTFRICTPATRQRAPFEEHNGANPRAIMNRKALNVGYD
jgi:hypothetical protein